MTTPEQSMARDRQRVTIAKCYFLLYILWIAMIVGLKLANIELAELLDFGFAMVTGALTMKIGDIIQFFFRSSGDKPAENKIIEEAK